MNFFKKILIIKKIWKTLVFLSVLGFIFVSFSPIARGEEISQHVSQRLAENKARFDNVYDNPGALTRQEQIGELLRIQGELGEPSQHIIGGNWDWNPMNWLTVGTINQADANAIATRAAEYNLKINDLRRLDNPNFGNHQADLANIEAAKTGDYSGINNVGGVQQKGGIGIPGGCSFFT